MVSLGLPSKAAPKVDFLERHTHVFSSLHPKSRLGEGRGGPGARPFEVRGGKRPARGRVQRPDGS